MMHWTGKLIGGLLGLLTLGPFGAAMGLILGHQYDESQRRRLAASSGADAASIGEQFFRSTFRLMGHVAKADGRVSEQEIAAARAIMDDLRLSPAQVRAAIEHFTAGKQRGFDAATEIASLGAVCTGRPDILRVFIEIQMRAALAGNNLEGPVRRILHRLAAKLGVSTLELAHMEAMLRIRRGSFRQGQPAHELASKQLAQAYEVLGIAPEASDTEVVKAYRRQLSRHHPDKLKANGLPESLIEHAKQQTQQIIEAYELIRQRRGI